MSWQAWFAAATVVLMFVALVRELASAEVILLTALAGLTAVGILSPATAVAGFGNEGLMTVAMMFALVSGLTQTGAMARLVQPLLGRPANATSAQLRLMVPVATLSAFLNNTPLVAMFMPVVDDWSRKIGVRPSKLFMPLSFAAILGGTCTLIGTSTNLVVAGLLQAEGVSIGLLEIAWVGVPCAIVGIAWCVIAGRWLLPDRKGVIDAEADPRAYTVEMIVSPGGPLVGRTVEAAGLRHLPGLFLAEIDRQGHRIPAVGPTELLQAEDRLVFVGNVGSVRDLQKIRGLEPALDAQFSLTDPDPDRGLVEAVVSPSSPLVGQSVRDARFRSLYSAVVVAVARHGQRIVGAKIGDIVLEAGDTLLLEARPSFLEKHRDSRDFFLVSAVEDSARPRHGRAWVALLILGAVVGLASFEVMSMLSAALLGAVAMVLTGCCTAAEVRRSVDLPVLVVIGAAFGIGKAIESTGLAATLANGLVGAVGTTPWFALAAVYGMTMVFNAFISNNAAAALMFPIAVATAHRLGADLLPFAIALMLAGSNDFATPVGYQTNLMVQGPGGYAFGDYLRFGGPLNLLMMLVSLAIIPLVWPLVP